MNSISLRVLIIALSSLVAHELVANDSLVYRSKYERSIIQASLSDKTTDYLCLYAAIDTDSSEMPKYEHLLKEFYKLCDSKVASAKTSKAKVKFLFNSVHDQFLRQYQEVTHFSTIFSTGVYNCVTASMLYSIVFDHYNVDYEIKEAPTHVYLVALPGVENILVETTNPNGFYSPDDKSKRAYVDGLISLKFTSQEYVNGVGYVKAFNEFYFRNDNINKRQLAALQYYNDAIESFQRQEMSAAVQNATKCELLYPATKFEYLKLNVIGQLLSNSDYSNLTDIHYLCDYVNLSKDNKTRKAVQGDFERIIRDYLLTKDDPVYPKKVFEVFRKSLRDTAVIRQIEYAYYYNLVSWHGTKSNFDQCLENAQLALAIKPKDVRLQEMIIQAIFIKSEKKQNKKLVIIELEQYLKEFPFLQSNKRYQGILLMHYCMVAYAAFNEDKEADGYMYLNQLQTKLETGLDNFEADHMRLGMPYAEAGAHHFRKKEYRKAEEILRKGLSLFPDHEELQERLKIVREEQRR